MHFLTIKSKINTDNIVRTSRHAEPLIVPCYHASEIVVAIITIIKYT